MTKLQYFESLDIERGRDIYKESKLLANVKFF